MNKEILQSCLTFIQEHRPVTCGPESNCDTLCVEAKAIGELEDKIRKFLKEFTAEVPDYADLVSVKQFLKYIRGEWLINDDGFGHPVKGNKMNTAIKILPSNKGSDIPEGTEKIAWFKDITFKVNIPDLYFIYSGVKRAGNIARYEGKWFFVPSHDWSFGIHALMKIAGFVLELNNKERPNEA